jgi:HEPN/Toprim N-terminal domain 1
MSTTVELRVGTFSVQTGRNEWYENHAELFQPTDLVALGTSDTVEEFALRKPFPDVLRRLQLLGIGDATVKREIVGLVERYVATPDLEDDGASDESKLTYEVFAALIASLDTTRDNDEAVYTQHRGFAKFFQREVAPRIGLALGADAAADAEELLLHVSGNALLWLLGRNPANVGQDVVWDFAAHVDAGYSTTDERVRPVRGRHRFLIVTEGTSDASILEKALAIRRPQIADFFYFYDASTEKFPFSGHGGILNFCRGLVAINVLNQTVVLFDNDAAGMTSFAKAEQMALPSNVRALKLPDLPPNTLFRTLGPDGESRAEINGRAAAIEAYLDLAGPNEPVVRWTNFEKSLGVYQGELEDKQDYAQRLYDLRSPYANYDFSKIDAVLDAIEETAVEIASSRVLSAGGTYRAETWPLS